jgi:hypothetical protein
VIYHYDDIGANGEMDEVAFYDLMDKKIALYFPVAVVLRK